MLTQVEFDTKFAPMFNRWLVSSDMFAMYFYHQWVMGEETIKGNVPSCSFSMIPVHYSSSAQQLQLSFELLAVAVPGALPCLYKLLGQHDI